MKGVFLFLSIRAKFILLIAIAFTAAMVLITLSSRDIFIKDKEAYLFENLRVGVLSDTRFIKSYIDNKKTITKSLFSNAVNSKLQDSQTEISLPKAFFFDNPSLIDFSIYHKGSRDFSAQDYLYNEKSKIKKVDKNELQKFNDDFIKSVYRQKANSDIIQLNRRSILRLGYYNSESRLLGIYRFDLSMILKELNSEGQNSKYLISDRGELLFSQIKETLPQGVTIDIVAKELIAHSNEQSLESDVKIAKIVEQRNFIAHSKIPDFGIHYFYTLDEESTQLVLFEMVLGMLKVSGGVLLVLILLVIFFTSAISKTLNSLIEVTKDASEGNFRKTAALNTGDEVGELVKNYNHMMARFMDVTKKLTDQNKKLEKKESAKSEDLKVTNDFLDSMVQFVDQGLFIFSRSGKILPMFTEISNEIFGKDFNLRNAKEVLPFGDPERASKLIGALFNESQPFDALCAKAPQFIGMEQRFYQEDDFKNYKLNYFAIRNKEGHIQFIAVVATDFSEEIKAKLLYKDNQVYLDKVNGILKHKTIFAKSLRKQKFIVSSIKTLIESSGKEIRKNKLMADLSDLKQFINQYKISELRKVFTTLEFGLMGHLDYINSIVPEDDNSEESDDRGLKDDTDWGNLQNIIVEIENGLKSFESFAVDVLGHKEIHEVDVKEEIARGELKYFREELIELAGSRDSEIVNLFDRKFLKVPIKEFFVDFDSNLQKLAVTNGVRIRPFEIHNGDILVDKVAYQEVFDGFLPILENITKYSIEPPNERESLGKDPMARVMIDFEVVRTKIEIRISDDGRGIDSEKVRESMRKLEYSEEASSENDTRVLTRLFDKNIQESSEDFHGAKMGENLEDLKKLVESKGGAAVISSKPNEGTIFKFRLPLQ